MQTIEILCMANSFKLGGRCVAGLRVDTRQWVRPVTDTPDGTLPYDLCRIDGDAVRPLDVVRVPVVGPSPRPHQPENWTLAPASWAFVRTMPLESAPHHLDQLVSRERGILGTRDDRVLLEEIRMRRRHASLALVNVSHPVFRVTYPNGSARVRCEFRHEGVDYDLSVTEDIKQLHNFGLPDSEGSHGSQRDWYFTISLTEPWNEACYKIVAGALPVVIRT